VEDVEVVDARRALRRYLFPGNEVASGFPKEKWFCSVSYQMLKKKATFSRDELR
jgi:hypothetical protein